MKNEQISEFLQSRIAERDFPSAVYLVAEKGEIVFEDALGFAVLEPEKIEAKLDTIYDLASLTKVLVTGLLCAKLIEEEKLNPLAIYHLPEFDYARQFPHHPDIGTWQLLYHCSDLPAWKPFYLLCHSREQVLDEILKTPPEIKSNLLKVKYSDLNFLILTFLLERIYGERIDEIAKKEIFEPLNLKDTLYNPPKTLRPRIAASEFGNYYEKQTCIESGYDVSMHDQRDYIYANLPNYGFRDYQIWGDVHDGNCWFMDGVSGHAGLFSTARETFRIAQQFLAEETVLLKPETCKLFRTNFTENLNEARSLAFQLAETKDSTASKALSKDSFGHLGFTGTSLWIEPESERIFILLTNRTHARELPFVNINSVRRRFHELAQEELDFRS